MARQTAINTSDDMRWLRDVHLKRLPAKYKSAIIVGNEDYPDRIEVYERRAPIVTDVPLVFEADEDGIFREVSSPKRHHATKKSPAQLQREINEVLANPGDTSDAFDPPRTMNVVDRHGGFTAVTRSGTLWRPGKAAPGGTFGSLVPGSVKRDDFYQNKQPVVSALYKLPSYGYKVKVWWEPSGARIA